MPLAARRLAQSPIAAIALDLDRECVWRGDLVVPLRPKAWAVLRCLGSQPGRLVSTAALLETAWPGVHVTPQTLTNVIREIRLALGEPRRPRLLQTVHRRGYVLTASLPWRDGDSPGVRSTPRPLLIARDGEMEQLRRCWSSVGRSDAEARVVLLCGEPGIGKTTLVESFVEAELGAASGRDAPLVLRGTCVEQHGEGEAYLPLLVALGAASARAKPAVEVLLRSSAPTWLSQMRVYAGEPERAVLAQGLRGTTPQRMLREGVSLFRELARRSGLLLVLEDLHWSDLATIDLLGALARERPAARLLVLASFRRADATRRAHRIVGLARDLVRSRLAVEMRLTPFDRVAVAAYLEARFPGVDASEGFVARLEDHTAGNPLFVASLVDELSERGAFLSTAGPWRLAPNAEDLLAELPATLREFVCGELESAKPEERELIEAASVLGERFSAEELAVVLEQSGAAAEAVCEALAASRRLLRVDRCSGEPTPTPGAPRWYGFAHASHRRIVLEQIAPLRRRAIERDVAIALETLWASGAEEAAARLAGHFGRAGEAERAIAWLERAARSSEARFAYRESAAYLEEALGLLGEERSDSANGAERDAMPPGLRRAEILLRIGGLVALAEGYSTVKVGIALERARALFDTAGSLEGAFRATMGLARWALTRSQDAAARVHTDRLIELADGPLPELRLLALCWAGFAASLRGDLTEARALLEEALRAEAAPGALAHQDHHRIVRSQLALVATLQGDLSQAEEHARRALARARSSDHPADLAHAYLQETERQVFLRDRDAARQVASELVRLAAEHGLASFHLLGRFYWAWADDTRSPGERAVALRGEIAARRAVEDRWHESLLLCLLAETELEAGNPTSACAALEAAHAHAERSEERYYEAEIERLLAECALAACDPTSFERALRHQRLALTHARAGGARLLELRAATGRARLSAVASCDKDGCGDLARVLVGFAAGSECTDLRSAREALAAFGPSSNRGRSRALAPVRSSRARPSLRR